jgi:hypothetical protein
VVSDALRSGKRDRFPKRRLVFHNEITEQQNPVFGSAFTYFGDRPGAFAAAFSSCLILQEAGDAARP